MNDNFFFFVFFRNMYLVPHLFGLAAILVLPLFPRAREAGSSSHHSHHHHHHKPKPEKVMAELQAAVASAAVVANTNGHVHKEAKWADGEPFFLIPCERLEREKNNDDYDTEQERGKNESCTDWSVEKNSKLLTMIMKICVRTHIGVQFFAVKKFKCED